MLHFGFFHFGRFVPTFEKIPPQNRNSSPGDRVALVGGAVLFGRGGPGPPRPDKAHGFAGCFLPAQAHLPAYLRPFVAKMDKQPI